MGEADWARTADAVRAAFDGGDLAALEPLLSTDVRWHGAGPGGCFSRAEVLATILEFGAGHRLVELRRAGPRILLRIAVAPSGIEVHQVLGLDGSGSITLLLDYTDAAVAAGDLEPAAARAAGAVDGLVPFVDVRDVPASVAFYALLGFRVTAEHRPHGRVVWAALRSGSAALMVAEAGEPVDAGRQGVLLYLYSDDLAGLRAHLRSNGVEASEIVDGTPGPRQEMRVDDPDGYCLMIARKE